MNDKQADALISDLLLKCDDEGIQLPGNPWDALGEAIAALRGATNHEMGRTEMASALEALRTKFGAKEEEAGQPLAPHLVRRQKRTLMQDSPLRVDGSAMGAMRPLASGKKKHLKKSRIQEQVEATPAVRPGNQKLVDQLIQLGEYEMRHGHMQRGLSRMRAAKQIRDSHVVITSGAQAQKLDRVGASVASKVDAILNEGLDEALREYWDEEGETAEDKD